MMIIRLLHQRLSKSKQSVLLLGPRQVGKSTLCRALKPDKIINLADEENFLRYSKDPGLLKREVAALKTPSLILIDEVQRWTPLLNTVQALMDESPLRHRFLLTGSSARKLKKSGVNLLPGRVIREFLGPLTCLELAQDKANEAFDLPKALMLGMLPGIYSGDEQSAAVLGTYADVYLREEIRHEALTRNIGAYARFLDMMAAISGDWLNYTKLSSDTEIPKSTVRQYVELLEDTLLLVRLLPFKCAKPRVSRRVSQRERVLLFDVGVRNAILNLHRQPLTPLQVGNVFEQWFILQVHYLIQAYHKPWKLFSYRSEGGAEVDLVIDRGTDILGIEVKHSHNIRMPDTRGLQSLKEYLPVAMPYQKYIAYLGECEQLLEEGTRVVPYSLLLLELFA